MPSMRKRRMLAIWKFYISTVRMSKKKPFYAPLVAGEIRSCFGMTEPEHAGSKPSHYEHNCREGWRPLRCKWSQVVHHRL